jgi:ABC-type Zn uptake system ZnuABC Zn-binding protein ZnuA
MKLKLLFPVLVLAVLAAACGSPTSGTEQTQSDAAQDSAVAGDDQIIAVADQPIADLVRRVAGEGYTVEVLVPLGADSHTYEPQPADAAALSQAALFIESGAGLNQAVSNLARENLARDASWVELAALIPPQDIIYSDTAEQIEAHGHGHEINAHFWPDVQYAITYVEGIREVMTDFAPDDAEGFTARADELVADLEDLHEAIAASIESIPEANRKLVVYHDAWSYFGRRYGMEIVGAIQPTDFSEPSAAEVRTIIEQIREEDVPAFFGSEVFPSGVLDAVAGETGAIYVADLSDDVLPGQPGEPQHSYIGMMAANARAITDALGGDSSSLDELFEDGRA